MGSEDRGISRLKKLRNFLGFSQRELADEFMVTSGAIAHWESGARPIPGPILRLMDIYEESIGIQDKKTSLVSSESLRASQLLMKEVSEALKNEGLIPCPQEKNKLFELLRNNFHHNLYASKFQLNIKTRIFQNVIRSLSGSRGLSLKAAQIASFLEMGISPDVSQAIGDLLLQAKPLVFSKIQEILDQAYGSYHNVFKKVSSQPLAVTSLAQLHRAELIDGTEVVVKIQIPEIGKVLNSQLRKINFIAQIGQILSVDAAPVIKDIENWVLGELDYEKEVYNQEKFRNIFSHEPRIVVPAIYRELCRSNIIVMEFMPGISFQAFVERAPAAQRAEAAQLIAYFHSYAIFRHGLTHGDAHPGNFIFNQGKVIFLDYGRINGIESCVLEGEKELVLAILSRDFEKFKEYFVKRELIKHPENFDFQQYWELVLGLQEHHLSEKPYKITREFICSGVEKMSRFKQRSDLVYNTNLLRSTLVNMTLMSLFADLDVEVNWRKQALEILKDAPNIV